MPPPIAVSTPEKDMARKFKPNALYAKVEPMTVNIPSPTASNFKNKFQCFFSNG
jgi:hypothetical protein